MEQADEDTVPEVKLTHQYLTRKEDLDTSMLEMSATYFHHLAKLVSLFYADPNLQVVLTGEGFNSLPHEIPGLEERSMPQQAAVFIHKAAIVLPSREINYVQNHPLTFYTEPGSQPGTCRLGMSSRTVTLIQKNDYGVLFQEHVEVRMDQNNVPKFFLNARAVGKAFQEIADWNMILLKGFPLEDGSPDVYCLKKYLAFQCPAFPEDAERMLYKRRRTSRWPSQGLMQRATEKGCHLVARGSNDPADDLDWELSFKESEACLFEDLSHHKRLAYCKAMDILSTMNEWHATFSSHHLQTAFLWSLEGMSEESFNSDVVDVCLVSILKQLAKFLEDKKCPNFFQPDMNHFDFIREDIMEKLWMKLQAVLEQIKAEQELNVVEAKPETQTGTGRTVCQDQNYFVDLFEHNICLLLLQMFGRLLNFVNVDQSIAKHKAVLQELERCQSQDQGGKAAFNQLRKAVTSSLGCAYLTKAIEAYYAKEKKAFLQKAEDCLMTGSDMDITQGRIKLANFYVKTKRFEKALGLLSDLITKSQRSSPTHPAEHFATALWHKWNHGHFAFDVMVSDLEKPCHLPTVQKSLMLFSSQMLGLLRRPVCVLDPGFFAQYLYVVSYAGMGHADRTGIQPILDEMEATAQQEQDSFLNDKKNVGYCNLLAHLYLLLEEREIAISMFKKSAKMMRGPGNPATLALFALRTEWIKKFCVRSASVAAVAALAILMFRQR